MLVLGLVSGLFICRSCSTPEEVEIVQIDSVVVRDTIREYYPVEIRTERIDTMRVVVRDTIRLKDTLYMSLPLERRTYKREDFYAEVTGYNPRLSYIEVYPETVYVTTTQNEAKSWHFSLDMGVDIGKGSMAYLTPNLSAEIGYKRWLLVGEIGVDVGIEKQVIQSPYFYYQAGLRYNLYRR